jgi:hypothetical protein
MRTTIVGIAAMCALAAGIYWAGGRENRAINQLKDKEGAEIVHETAKDTLDGIGVDIDADSLLRRTNGLRNN